MKDLDVMPAIFKFNRKIEQHVETKYNQSFFPCLRLLLMTFIIASNWQPTHAVEVSLAWDSSNEAMGYKIYYGFESRNYPFVVDLGLWAQCTISDLNYGQMYYFAVTAYNEFGESDFSREVAYKPKACDADLDMDGEIDGSDLAGFISNPLATTLSDFAARFGTGNCLKW